MKSPSEIASGKECKPQISEDELREKDLDRLEWIAEYTRKAIAQAKEVKGA